MSNNLRFAVFASGHGGNLQAIINAVKKKQIKSRLALIFSDKAEAYALARAKKSKIPTLCVSPKTFSSREDFDRVIVERLKAEQIDYVVLAGYMRLLSPYFIKQYADRIINIHPSLLPAFKGTHAIKDAFEYGVKVTGVTVHFVVDEMDAGEIIAQEVVAVKPTDTLERLEKKILIR